VHYIKTTTSKILLCILVFSCESASEKTNREVEKSKEKKQAGSFKPDGMAIFRKHCVTCHGTDGKLGLNGAKDLSQSVLSVDQRVEIITYGKKLMTPFGKILTPEEINAVANYTLTLKAAQ
jgi:cytochrome c6